MASGAVWSGKILYQKELTDLLTDNPETVEPHLKKQEVMREPLFLEERRR